MRIAFLKICFLAIVFVSCSQNKQNTSGGKMVKDYSVLTMVPKSVTVHQDFPATIQGQRVIEIRPMDNQFSESFFISFAQRDFFFLTGNYKFQNPILRQYPRLRQRPFRTSEAFGRCDDAVRAGSGA